MKHLKTIFACLLMAVLSIGQMWGLTNTYTKITSATSLDESAEYVIGDVDNYGCPTNTGGTAINTTEASWVHWNAKNVDGGFYLYNGAVYLKVPASNAWGSGTSSDCSVLTANSEGILAGNDGTNDRILVKNSSNAYLRWYKSGQTKAYLYKIEASSSTACATPTFSPEAGSYEGAQNVTITSTDGATIYYTTDGSTPTTSSSVYSSSISVSADMTIKAYAVKSGLDDSEVATAAYTITEGPDVTLDFTSNTEWAFPTSKQISEGTYSDGTYTVKVAGSTGNGFNFNSGKLLLGKLGAYLILPEFEHPIARIECPGVSGASGSVTWNVFDGDNAVSTEVTGCTADKSFEIEPLEANKEYTIKVTNGNNLQISKIKIFFGAAPAVAKPTISGDVNFVGSTTVTITHADADHIYYTTNGVDPTTSSDEYTTPFSLTNTATVKAIAVKGSDVSAVAEKTFTKATVLTVAQARTAIDAGGDLTNKYVAGIISQIDSYNSTYKSITYWISDDGTTTDQLQVYSGLAGIVKAEFASVEDLNVGDDVTVKGTLKKYSSTYEFDKNNEIVARKPIARLSWSGTTAGVFEASLEGGNTFPTLTNSDAVIVSYSSSETSYASFSDASDYSTLTLNAVGSTTITASFAGNPSFKANSVSYTLNVSSSVIKANISFECNGATSCPETMLAQSNLPSPLPTVTKAGKNFGGWFTDSEFNTPAVAGAAVASTDPITLYAKWLEPYNIAAAKAVIDANTSGIANQYVAGKISQIDSYNSTYHSITYWISDDGTTTDQIQVYSGLIGNAATPLGKEAFDAKENLELGDEVVVFGTLKLHNSDVYEFDKNNTIYSFNRPAKPTITADPAEVTNVVAEGVTNQTIALTYDNIENYLVEVTLHDDAEGTEAFSDTWLTASVSGADNYATITYSVAANEGAARTAYMKVYAIGDDDKEATKIIAVSQEAYVAPALPAELPFAFDGGRADIESTQGMSQEGLDSDYGSSPKLKFNTTGDYVIINIASDPGKLTYDIIGNGFSGGTFKVQESVNGVDYTDVATYTELGAKASEEKTLAQTTRFVKFIYTEKVSGNVALGNIAIAEYVAPAAVETPAFSPAGGEYAGAQSVTISCETVGATIYYTTNGDDPDNTKTLYEGAINVDATMTIKAVAYKDAEHSEIATATYTITAPLTDYYEKVTSGDVAEGTYLIVYEAGSLAFDGGADPLDAVENSIAVDIVSGNKIGVTSATEAATFYIDPTAGTIQAASGKYIGQTSDANGLGTSESASTYTNSFSFDEGNAVIVSSSAHLCYNSTSNQLRFRYYKSSSYSSQQPIALYKLANEVVKPASGLAWDPADDIEITVGDAFTAPTLLNPKEIPAGDITIESSNTDLATVSAGVVSLVADATGTTTITATYTGETYKPITVSYKITVNPAASIYVSPSLNVNFGSVVKDAALPADKTITVTLNNVATATATLGGTNPEAFSIDPATLTENGDITISVVSTATVANYAATLTISDDAGNAESKVVNLSFSVTEPAGEETPVSTTSEWVPSTEITDGMQVLIVGERNEKIYAVGAQTSNNRTAVEGSLSEGVFTPGENTMAFTVVAQEGGTYALQASNGKYLYAAGSGSGKNFLRSQDEVDDNAKWTLSVSSATANGTNTNNKLQLNNSSDIFSCYSSTQKAIQFYVPKPAPAPEYETVRSGLVINRYYTVCLPKKVTAIKGASFWTLNNKSQDGATAYLEEETNKLPFAAGTPFIIQATAENLEVVYEGAATEDAGTNGALHGTLVYMDAAALAAAGSDIYMLFNNELRPVGDDNHLDANRAYVLLSELNPVAEAPQSAPGKRVRAMPMQPQTATGIEDLNASEKPMKMMINGQIFILRGEKMYDTTGRLVK